MARYRCKQLVVLKQDSIVKTHAETKREFVISKSESNLPVPTEYMIKMVDNIISFYPSSMQDMMNIMCEIDNIKCNVRAVVHPATGKINKIINHSEIIKDWDKLSIGLKKRFGFVEDEKTKKNFAEFILTLDKQICNEKLLIADLETKLFFDLFFDKYLISKNLTDPYQLFYHSQIFNDVPITLKVESLLSAESPTQKEITKIGVLDKTPKLIKSMEDHYNQYVKSTVGYKFSSYDFSYRARTTIHKEQNLIENAEVTILEEIKNNIQIAITYLLNRIEL